MLRYFALYCTICTYFQRIYGVLCGRLCLYNLHVYTHTHIVEVCCFLLPTFLYSIFAVFSRNFIFNKMEYILHPAVWEGSKIFFLTKSESLWKWFVSCIFIFFLFLYPLAVRFFARSVNNLFLSFLCFQWCRTFSVLLTCMCLYNIVSFFGSKIDRKKREERREELGYEWAYKRWNAYII